MDLNTQAERLNELRDEIVALADRDEAFTAEDEARYTELNTEFDELREQHEADFARAADYAARAEVLANFRAGAVESPVTERTSGLSGFQHKSDRDPFEGLEQVRYAPEGQRVAEYRGRALKAIESARYAEDGHAESAASLVERGDHRGERARYIVEHDGPEYVEGFRRYMTNPAAGIAHAVRGLSERAAMSLTAANGGVAVPQFLDPTVILTNNGSENEIRGIARVETITVDQWDGVSSAGVTAEWIAENTQVADASPTFSAPTITVHKADAYVEGSIEVISDSALSGELAGLLADAKANLEATAHAVGSGSGQPFGIVTALGLTTASRVAGSSGAAGAADLVAADIYALDNDLGARYRQNAKFLGNKAVWNRVRQLGTSNTYHAFWTDFGGGLPSQLIGYDVHKNSAMDSTIVSGSNDDVIILGDFRNYVVVDRMGMELVYNPLVVGANQRPTGTVGWVAFWRNGADSVNDAAFRMLRL